MHIVLKPSHSNANTARHSDRFSLSSLATPDEAGSTNRVSIHRNDLSFNHSRSRSSRSQGFALMLALGLMSFVLLLILSMSSFVQINANVANAHKDATLAKQNALFALKLAIGNLQNEMGPDKRISATAGILDEFPETEAIDSVAQPHWTGVWDSENALAGNEVEQTTSSKRNSSDGKPSNFRQWLVSLPTGEKNAEDLIEFAKTFSKNDPSAIELVGDGTLGSAAEVLDYVYAPRQVISQTDNQENGYAYWVGDEGVKSKLAGEKKSSIQTDYETILDANNASNPRLNAIEGFENTKDISDQVDKLLSFETAEIALSDAIEDTNVLKNNYHSLSIYNKGLLVDVKNGGIKKDLSLLFTNDELPIEYHNEPIFTYQGVNGADWNYAHRYHNIYKKIRNDQGRNYIKISDFWDEADHKIPYAETKYADLPIPVLARQQVIFSLFKGRNTWNGRYIAEVDQSSGGGRGRGRGGNYILDDIADPQNNNEDILYMMMNPYFYLWNPYNVELVMDVASKNKGSLEYFYAPPHLEFSFNGSNWVPLGRAEDNKSPTFQYGRGYELLCIWSSNNWRNGKELVIPAGEFKINRVSSIIENNANSGPPDYKRLQFYEYLGNNGLSWATLWGDKGGVPIGWDAVTRWVESTDDPEGHQMGLFSPVVNYKGFTSPDRQNWKTLLKDANGNPKNSGDRLEMRISDDYHFRSILSMGGGWNTSNPAWNLSQGPSQLEDRRLVGALNLNSKRSVGQESYHESSALVNGLNLTTLPDIVDDQGYFSGIDNSNVPKIGVYVDMRGFTEKNTPGKHAFFVDPANTYYYDDNCSDTSLALSPFRVYVKPIEGEIFNLHPITDQIGFKTQDGELIYKSVAKELPLVPLTSIAQLDHAPLGRDYEHFAYYAGRKNISQEWQHWESKNIVNAYGGGKLIFPGKSERPMAPAFNMAVGNSWAHPIIPLNGISDLDPTYKGYAIDRSYLLNEALFDSYFFTGLAIPSGPFLDDMPEISNLLKEWQIGTKELANTNYKFRVPSSMTAKEANSVIASGNLDPMDIFDKLAAFIEVDGAFNINSTSKESWIAQLSALRDKAILYEDPDYDDYQTDDSNIALTPVLSQTIPTGKSLDSKGGQTQQIIEDSWSHYRSLDDFQIVKLAKEIVKQVKIRGPFLSLSQFFNREISERFPYNQKGAIQTAIDDSLINLESPKKNISTALRARFDSYDGNQNWIGNADFDSPEIFDGDINAGLPGYITQSSLMRPLAPYITPRSETFTIRTYGDVVSNGEVVSKAWCEAVVQRRIDLVESDNIQVWDTPSDNLDMNRKFEIVSFRWLNEDEI